MPRLVFAAETRYGSNSQAMQLTSDNLEKLRDRLKSRGERPSMVLPGPKASVELLEAVAVVQEYGSLVEAMFLVMFADRKVKNVERDVLRGALRVLSSDRVRSTHLESMLDVAARNVAEQGYDARLAAVIEGLRGNEARAEITWVLGNAVAAADGAIVPAEEHVLDALAEGLGLDVARCHRIAEELEKGTFKA